MPRIAETVRPLPIFDGKLRPKFAALTAKHGIPADFNLAFKLRSIVREAHRLRLQPLTAGYSVRSELTEQRRASGADGLKGFAQRVRKSTINLRALLGKASDEELSFLIHRALPDQALSAIRRGNDRSFDKDWNQLVRAIAWLEACATEAATARFPKGRRIDPYSLFVAVRLRHLYVEVRGPKAPLITFAAGMFSGPFVCFMADVLPYLGVRPASNKALGQLCTKAIRTVHGEGRPRRSRRAQGDTRR